MGAMKRTFGDRELPWWYWRRLANRRTRAVSPLSLPSTPGFVVSMFRVNGYSGPMLRVDNGAGVKSNVAFGAVPLATDYIDTWYDQSGFGRHAVQATLANMPLRSPETPAKGLYPAIFQSKTGSLDDGVRKLVAPTSITGVCTNYSFFMVVRTPASSDSLTFAEIFKTSGAGNNPALFNSVSDTIYHNGVSTPMSEPISRPHASLMVLGVTCGSASNSRLHVNDTVVTVPDDTARTIAGLGLQPLSWSGGLPTKMDVVFAAFWPSRLSDVDVAALKTSLYTQLSVPGVPTKNVTIIGDSIVAGFLAGKNGPFAVKLADGLTNARVQANGIGASTLASWDTNFLTRVLQYDASIVNNVMLVEAAVNDFGGGATAAAVRASLESVVTKSRTLGYDKVIVCTTTQGNFVGSQETERDAFNAALRADHAFADDLIDWAADSRLDTFSGTYFQDGVHPNLAGHAIMAEIALPVVEAA